MNIMPEGESLRNAVKYISEALQEDAGKSVQALVQEASLKFDLTPADADFLSHFYKDKIV